MPIVARTIGGPGAGKTHRALEIMDMILEQLVHDPLRIGFVSFTRAARREASSRAADRFNVTASSLEREGYFRTLHSIAFRQLGIQPGELLAGSKEDSEWLKNALGDERVRLPSRDADDEAIVFTTDSSDAGKALALWDVARNRQIPLESAWDRAGAIDEHLPELSLCQATASLYEQAKRSDGRLDFCDLLMLFAGRRWSGQHDSPWADADPRGDIPALPVWIHDEAQDMSLLTSLVFRRIIQPSTWVYLMGDQAQSIFGWAGTDGRLFADWPAAKEEELPLSYRCGQEVLDFSYRVLAKNRDVPLGRASFKSATGAGSLIVRSPSVEAALGAVRPGEDTLILGRTNEYAREAARLLDELCLPWLPTKGGGGANAPARAAGVAALVTLRKGEPIDGVAWWRLLQLLPSKANGTQLFVAGTKTFFDEKEERERHPPITLRELPVVGGTRACMDLIASGKYVELLEKPAASMAQAAQKHGLDAVLKPTIRVGTMHSAKGMGAAHVIAVNRIPLPTQRALDDLDALEEERRLWYVTCSRAKRHLTIAESEGEPFQEI